MIWTIVVIVLILLGMMLTVLSYQWGAYVGRHRYKDPLTTRENLMKMIKGE